MFADIIAVKSPKTVWFYVGLFCVCAIVLFFIDHRIKSGVVLYRPGAYYVGRYVFVFVCIVVFLKIIIGLKQCLNKDPVAVISDGVLVIYSIWGNKKTFPVDKIKMIDIKKSFLGDKVEINLVHSKFRTITKRLYEVDVTLDIINKLKNSEIPVKIKTR